MYVRMICAMLVCIALGGCATGGMKFTEMRSAGPRLPSGQARIYFYRSGTPVGLAVQPSIKVDGTVVGTAIPGGFFFVDRPAGKYEITATTEVEEKIHIALAPGETKYVQFYLTPGLLVGHANLNEVSREKAESEMADLSRTGTLTQ
jgi:hypothetical protein